MYLIFTLILGTLAAWPPSPNTQAQVGVDIPGSDFPNMPVTLPSANYQLCAQMCEQTTGCRAWAYAIPGCDQYQHPMCWIKFVDPHNQTPNRCRVSGLSSNPCQMTTKWTKDVDPSVSQPLPEYPRPQMARDEQNFVWKNLNGLWEWQPAQQGDQPPFGKNLTGQILVPFPTESCLSGIGWNYEYMWYRLVFDVPSGKFPNYVLNFGAVDWQTTVYLNGVNLGIHTGGYDGFSFDITRNLKTTRNELLIFVYDPSDHGRQVFGKQRVSAMTNPGGDTYTPNSGIWQTVWIENVPPQYITALKIIPTLDSITLTVQSNTPGRFVANVMEGTKVVVTANGISGTPINITVPSPKIWDPENPYLYNLEVKLGADIILGYFGLRTINIGKDQNGVTRPLINGKFTFLAGWLDQSWWPDGVYTAPTDEALAFDLYAIKRFGYNFVRLHQKVNSERWYWYADTLGIIVQQDMVQHYGDAFATPDPALYMQDLKAMIDGRYNHPSIIYWTAFNEGDMVGHFNATAVVQWIKNYDPYRLVDTDSGGPANDLHVGDVNDIHDYPDPQDPKPSETQFAEIGEFGGLGAYINGHMWVEGACQAYETLSNPVALADRYIQMTQSILSHKNDVSVSVYTQITDVERECDGFYNMDRTDKFDENTVQRVAAANQALIKN